MRRGYVDLPIDTLSKLACKPTFKERVNYRPVKYINLVAWFGWGER